MARRDGRASSAALQVLDHVPHGAVRADHPRRLRLLRDLTAPVDSARAHQARIDELWDYDDPAASEQRFRAAAESSPEPTRSILLTQVVRALGLQERFDDALAALDSLNHSTPELGVRIDLERGRVLNSSGDQAGARPLFEAAFSTAQDARLEHLAIDALHMVAIVAPNSERDGLNRGALAMASEAADPRAQQWRASLLNNIGWTAFDRGDYSDALALFEDALAARLEQGKVPEIQVARWCVARTLRALGRDTEALEILQALALEHRSAGTSDSYVDEEIAALTQTRTRPEPGSG